ncbi:unnamed protein product [Blepharisma stoltei]|uniref:Rubisco LSMT substrate-binding domain-containing protein n=1 Tax=Blepharisma stoltei TaxID=1481888 RepID=A0AAU9I918_9CILI|nr:unnamed protein product [Blepharisma stoltei]
MKSYSQWNRVIRNYPQHFSAGMTKYKIFDWAYKLVKTRCFRNPAGELALIPVAELLNHGNNCASYNWYKEESKLNDRLMISPSNNISGLVKDLVAIESLMIDQQPANNNYSIMINTDPNSHVETGKEVFLSYGEYPNRTLLLDYGFSLNENTYDYAIISITTDDISEGLFLESLANKEKYSFIVKKNELCRELIFLLKSFDTHISNFEGERNAINLALNIIHRKLMDFPTLIDEDQKILNHSLNFRNFAAVISKEG